MSKLYFDLEKTSNIFSFELPETELISIAFCESPDLNIRAVTIMTKNGNETLSAPIKSYDSNDFSFEIDMGDDVKIEIEAHMDNRHRCVFVTYWMKQ